MINTSGNIICDSIATEPADNKLLNIMDQRFMILTIPGRVGLTSHFDVIDQRYIDSARSDQFTIRVFDTDTDTLSENRYPLKRIKLSEAEKQNILES
jgi:hypothetical protein